jgi:hypothetical protein
VLGGNGGGTSGNGGGAFVLGGSATDGNGGAVTLTGAAGVGTNRSGGGVTATAGASTGAGSPGNVSLTAGTGGTGDGGFVSINGGTGGSGGTGGAAFVNGGGTTSATGLGGQATVTGGTYTLNSLGWLLTWYAMRKQWESRAEWQSWLRAALSDSLGQEAVERVSELFLLGGGLGEFVREASGLVGNACAVKPLEMGAVPHSVPFGLRLGRLGLAGLTGRPDDVEFVHEPAKFLVGLRLGVDGGARPVCGEFLAGLAEIALNVGDGGESDKGRSRVGLEGLQGLDAVVNIFLDRKEPGHVFGGDSVLARDVPGLLQDSLGRPG